jgi:hypothetical protein
VSTIFLRLDGLPTPGAVRMPLLEAHLARADAPLAVGDWRAVAWRTVATGDTPLPGIAAAALCAAREVVAEGFVAMATPVHCEAGMVSVRLPANGLVRLDAAAASRLAAAFNAGFAGSGPRLLADRGGRLMCLVPEPLTALTHDPQRVCGRDIGDYLPGGPDGARLRRLGAEIEMWLHEHPLNAERMAAGEPAITGLWLWGGGAPLHSLPALAGWTAGEDPLFGAWPGVTAFPAQPATGVIVIDAEPGGAGWAAAQANWLEPALAALGQGRVSQLDLSLGDQLYPLRRAQILRFWRRAQPWWEALG